MTSIVEVYRRWPTKDDDTALAVIAAAPITDAEVEAVARALAKAAHQHVLGAARWQKWTPDARAAILAYRAMLAARPPETEKPARVAPAG